MSVNAANPLAVATAICPEIYQVAKSVLGVADYVSVAETSVEFSGLTDANGNYGLYINFHGLTAPVPGGAGAWFAVNTINNVALQFVPATGVAAAAGTVFSPGPYPNNANPVVRDFLILGASIEILPIVSDLNNQGMCEVGMFKN